MDKNRAIDLFGLSYEVVSRQPMRTGKPVIDATLQKFGILYPVIGEKLGRDEQGRGPHDVFFDWACKNHLFEYLLVARNGIESEIDALRLGRLTRLFFQKTNPRLLQLHDEAIDRLERAVNAIIDRTNSPETDVSQTLPDAIDIAEPHPVGSALYFMEYGGLLRDGYSVRTDQIVALDVCRDKDGLEPLYHTASGKQVAHSKVHAAMEMDTEYTSDFDVAMEVARFRNECLAATRARTGALRRMVGVVEGLTREMT